MKVERQGVVTLTTIQLSGAISLPVLVAGYYAGLHYGTQVGMAMIALANVILFLFSLIYAAVAVSYRDTTVMIAKHFFGDRGTMICAIGLLSSLIGWGVIQLHYMTMAIMLLLPANGMLIRTAIALLCTGALYLMMCRGLSRFARLNQLMLPIYIGSLAVCLLGAKHGVAIAAAQPSSSLGIGLVLLLTTASGLLFDLPTYYRHAESSQAANRSLFIIFLVILPVIEGLGLYLAHFTSLAVLEGGTVMSLFSVLSASGLVFFILSSYFSNCLNWYSAAMVTSQLSGMTYQRALFCIATLCLATIPLELDDLLLPLLELTNVIGEIILCLIAAYVCFRGLSFSKLQQADRRGHSAILYFVLATCLILHFLPNNPYQDLFINAGTLSILVMSLYTLVRKF